MKIDPMLEALLVQAPKVVNYNQSKFFEVQPGRTSPLFINIKNTLGNLTLRKAITKNLIVQLKKDTDLICGIESGGSFYASIAAEQLNKPLVLLRKNNKTYAEEGRFVGTIPYNGKRAVIIDDVLVSGTSIEPAVTILNQLGYLVDVLAIFSFGNDDLVQNKLSVHVTSMMNISNLLTSALDKNILSPSDVNFLRDYIAQQKTMFLQTESMMHT